ncbi:MAG: manganese efflux pump MntP family protein [Erysipelotrichaceae bacterium]
MNLTSIIFIAIGLSMDAAAVSMAKGMCLSGKEVNKVALRLGFWFGLFQALMPLIGWWAGTYFEHMITSIDHWIAFILLFIIGGKMIWEGSHPKDTVCEPLTLKLILILAIATSIDALAIGISFAFLQVDILQSILLIGITTFLLSFICVYIGNRLGSLLEKYAEFLGGSILIFIGIKILLEHTLLS